MAVTEHTAVGNDLIDSLQSGERDRLRARCETVDLVPGANLCDAGRVYEYAWFPLTGLISHGTKLRRHSSLDMGLIGPEGMLGATLALGVDTAPLQAVVSGTGTALRMSKVELRRALSEGDSLRQRIDHYLYTVLTQIARTAACNQFHAIGPRLARCLLIARDRASSDHLYLTHESLAAMLGVRRSGITVAAHALGDRGLIEYSRGSIAILDRDGLQAAACSCYADWPTVTPI